MQRRVPLAKPWTVAMLSWQGHSTAEIARRLHVADKTVRGWLNRLKPERDGHAQPD
ncbi:helix-turn-helix domain-containing protein [Pseudorhodobacter sp.]|uniref:helix-turn-helix domain-containing protein n=1 Tax=Pseudorhodobacter sp. TaxID=1934400 RepID=UPI002647AAAE|nr:helix-turn-helix domain-containing protein [Pseudorhodobacter sp.]MDN5787120.1 sigma-70 region 4 domain-containing protein [Pseudorhodobacter sp.]